MRKIRFRGKDSIHKEWIYGFLAVDSKSNPVILPQEDWSKGGCVDESTIGQFTGLYDKTGNEIYEDDIVLQKGYNGTNTPRVVHFDHGSFNVGYHKGSSTKISPMLLNKQCEVIGNVYDNPELLED